MYQRYLKRGIDIVLSFLALLVLGPLMIVFGILIKYKLGSPVIFKQKRPGKSEKVFTMYKFRTMTNAVDSQGDLLPDEERLTKFGKFLRATSIDELPELLNILKGDMSIIGPRPLLVDYLEYYNDTQRLRHSVRPGLTGLAQISGRNTLSWETKFEMDLEYIDNITFSKDMKIIVATVLKVIKRDGINTTDNKIMPRFDESIINQRSIEDE